MSVEDLPGICKTTSGDSQGDLKLRRVADRVVQIDVELRKLVTAASQEGRSFDSIFIDHYNFSRPHQGLEGLVPADRYFNAAPEVLATQRARVAANALELARQDVPKKAFYLTGQLEGQPFSVHREGDRVVLRQAGGRREDIDLMPPDTSPQLRGDGTNKHRRSAAGRGAGQRAAPHARRYFA